MSTGKRVAVALLVCTVLYPPLKLYWAKRQVTAFCNDIAVGASVEELERVARDHWLLVQKARATTIEGKPIPARLLVWEGFAFGRWYCEIHDVNGRVESTRINFLD